MKAKKERPTCHWASKPGIWTSSRVWLVVWTTWLTTLGISERANAKHDLFVQLLFREARATAASSPGPPRQRLRVPVSVGVPIPIEARIINLDRVLLVGAEDAQLRIVSRWPDGSARWILVHTQVDVRGSQPNAAYYLTSGQPPKARAALARETGGKVMVDTGAARFAIARATTSGLFSVLDLGDKPFAAHYGWTLSIHGEREVSRPIRREVTVEENGPIRSVIRVREKFEGMDGTRSELILTQRLIFHRGKDFVTLRVSSSGTAATGWTAEIRGPIPRNTGPTRSAIVLARDLRSGSCISSSIGDRGATRISLAPVGNLYHECRFALNPGVDSKTLVHRFLHPVIGRAVSVKVYNESRALAFRLLAERKTPQNLLISRAVPKTPLDDMAADLYRFLTAPGARAGEALPSALRKAARLVQRSPETWWSSTGDSERRAPLGAQACMSLLVGLTGDEELLTAYTTARAALVAATQGSASSSKPRLPPLYQLIDLAQVDRSSATSKLAWESARRFIQEAKAQDEHDPSELARIWGSLLTLPDGSLEDRLLVESALTEATRGERSPMSVVHRYVLTRDASLLGEARSILDRATDSTSLVQILSRQTLRCLIEDPKRFVPLPHNEKKGPQRFGSSPDDTEGEPSPVSFRKIAVGSQPTERGTASGTVPGKPLPTLWIALGSITLFVVVFAGFRILRGRRRDP